MNGIGATKFAPNRPLSRGMIVTILYRMKGSPADDYAMTFSDVAADKWYTKAIRWAKSTGVVKGYNNTSFGSNDSVTREQLAAILYRFADYKGLEVSAGNDLTKYTDRNEISAWALVAVRPVWAITWR